jgi:SgrR family transcriptional regulator
MTELLAEQGVKLVVQEIDYAEWHQGEAESDIWLNSVNFTMPLEYSLFAQLYEVPLIQKCIPGDWQGDARRWHSKTLALPEWCKQMLERNDVIPLIHHWLRIEGQRSMRGVRMNTLGWFDFKSAWFAPPGP